MPDPFLPGRPPLLQRSTAALLVAVAYVGLVLLHWWLAAPRSAPVLYHDAAGYLSVARYLAGVPLPGRLLTPYTHFGYSLTLIPAWWMGASLEEVYRAALTINGLLAAAAVVPLYLLARRLLGLARGASLAVAATASLYPSVLLNSGLVWAENLLPVLWCTYLLVAAACWRRPSWPRYAALGLVSVAAVAVHPRAVVLAAATVALAATARWKRRAPWLCFAVAATVTSVGLLAVTQANQYLHHAVWWEEAHRVAASWTLPARALRMASRSWSRRGELLAASAGQLWYLLAASAGLVLVGVVRLGTLVRSAARSEQRLLSALILGGSLFSLVASVGQMAGTPGRLDAIIYGRYNEGFVAPLLLAGLAGLLPAGPRSSSRWLLAGALGVSFGGLALTLHYGALRPRGGLVPHTVLGVLPWGYAYSTLFLGRCALGAAALGMGLAALHRLRRGLALIVLPPLAVLATLRVEGSLYYPLDIENHRLFTLADTISTSHLSGEVGYDRSVLDEAALNAYLLGLRNQRVVYFDSRTDPPPTDLVIGAKGSPPSPGPWVRLAVEASRDQGLWSAPGRRLSQVRSAGVSTIFEAESLYSGKASPWRLTRSEALASGGAVRRWDPDDGDGASATSYLVQGPRVPGLVGAYRVEISGWSSAAGAGVEATGGGEVLARGRLPGRDRSANGMPSAQLAFEIRREISDLEFRVTAPRGVTEVDAVKVTRFPPEVLPSAGPATR